MNKTYKILTFGCQMNENDSERLSGILKNMGYTKEEDVNKAGVVILNTCSVRENADVRVFGNIGTFKSVKKKNPDLVLAICGCMMQQPQIVKAIKEKYKQVDLVFGTHNIHKLPELLANHLQNGEQTIEVWEDSNEIIEGIPVDRRYPFKSYVTIMNGCNNFCSYCIVPYTRGREVSRQHDAIVNEVKALSEDGCLEITLLGQNVNSYGKDLKDGYYFADLLKDINKVEKLQRIRFMTSHPKDMSEEVIDAIASCDKVCPSVHLAIQSGSTRILREMNRKYTKEYIVELVEKIRNKIPEVAITTDIIVGFPGETQEDFEDTIDVLEKCRFDSAFSFIYSIRTGTPAAKMENQIPDAVKHQRIDRLLEVLREISSDLNATYLNKTLPVLVEEPSKNREDRLSGRTASGKLVNFTGNFKDIGKIVSVKITKTGNFSLTGEQV